MSYGGTETADAWRHLGPGRCIGVRSGGGRRSAGGDAMKFQRRGPLGSEQPVVETDEGVFDLRPVAPDIDGAFLAADGIQATRDALRDGRLPRVDDLPDRVGAPLARPGKIVCIGLNYRDHAAETGAAIPDEPI